jgi:hypothetical protein
MIILTGVPGESVLEPELLQSSRSASFHFLKKVFGEPYTLLPVACGHLPAAVTLISAGTQIMSPGIISCGAQDLCAVVNALYVFVQPEVSVSAPDESWHFRAGTDCLLCFQ